MVNFLSLNGSTCSYWDNWYIDFFINTILWSQVIKLHRGDISGCTCRPAHKYMSSCGSANVRTSVSFLLSCSQPRLCYLSLLCTASICSRFACKRGGSLKCIWWQVPVVCLHAVYKYTPDNKVTVNLPACLHEISKRVSEKHGYTGTGETWWHSFGTLHLVFIKANTLLHTAADQHVVASKAEWQRQKYLQSEHQSR